MLAWRSPPSLPAHPFPRGMTSLLPRILVAVLLIVAIYFYVAMLAWRSPRYFSAAPVKSEYARRPNESVVPAAIPRSLPPPISKTDRATVPSLPHVNATRPSSVPPPPSCVFTSDLHDCLSPRRIVQHPHCPHPYRAVQDDSMTKTAGAVTPCSRPLLIFHHIQKSGGSAIKVVLETKFRSEYAYAGAPFAMPRVDCQTDILFTDMAVGLCDSTTRPCYYAHSIREPFDRWRSSYHYFCRRGAERGHLWLPQYKERGRCDATFVQWVTNKLATGGAARPDNWSWANNTLLQRFAAQWSEPSGAAAAAWYECAERAALSNLVLPCSRFVTIGGAPKLASFFHDIGLLNVTAQELDYVGNPGIVHLESDLGDGIDAVAEHEIATVRALLGPDSRFYEKVEELESKQWDRRIEAC
mmetsp:Transcript_8880/g.28351  ORF Transcript_8880/g.28351 Transcript_8880/m.28351 type:complete len:412 (-) Transcript_8880:68-1303(-)